MSERIQLECEPINEFGWRRVVARCDGAELRDSFDTNDAYSRQLFAQAVRRKFGGPITRDNFDEIEAKIVEAAKRCDARTPAPERVKAESVCLAEVPTATVDWLWPGRIATGKVTLVAGDPGLGKSFVTLDMAARVSTGASWPEVGASREDRGASEDELSLAPCSSFLAPAGGVVLLSAEDDLADTVRPRLEAARADCSRIVALRAMAGSNAEGSFRRTFDLGRDVEHLTGIVERMGDCRLVVIDPISAYLGRTVENFNAEVRTLIGPLAELATRFQLAVVAVTHLRKGGGAAIYRAMGSVAFVAASRAVWMIIKDEEQPSRRLFLPLKNNLGDDSSGLAYTIASRSDGRGMHVVWSDEAIVRSITVGEPAPMGRPSAERDEAIGWLLQTLRDGPTPTSELKEAGAANGFSFATLRRAFRQIGGQAVKVGGGGPAGRGQWLWKLPEQDTHRAS